MTPQQAEILYRARSAAHHKKAFALPGFYPPAYSASAHGGQLFTGAGISQFGTGKMIYAHEDLQRARSHLGGQGAGLGRYSEQAPTGIGRIRTFAWDPPAYLAVSGATSSGVVEVTGGGAIGIGTSPRRGVVRQAAPARDPVLYEAAEALKQTSIEPASGAVGHAASLMRRAAEREADVRPRHAAVALAVWDAIECTVRPFGTQGRRQVLWEAARLLLSQFISTDDELTLLDRMHAVGLERVPPFEDTVAGAVFEDLDGDSLR